MTQVAVLALLFSRCLTAQVEQALAADACSSVVANTQAQLLGAFGAGETYITVCKQVLITGTLLIPNRVHIEFIRRGGFRKGNSGAVRIAGSIPDRPQQFFFGFEPGDVRSADAAQGTPWSQTRLPQWWGALGDSDGLGGGTDNTTAIQCAIDSGVRIGSSTRTGDVFLGAGSFRVGNLTLQERFAILRGSNVFATSLHPDATLMAPGSAVISMGASSGGPWNDYSSKLERFSIGFQDDCPAGLSGIRAVDDLGESTEISNIWILGFSDVGIDFPPAALGLGVWIHDCTFGNVRFGSSRAIRIVGGQYSTVIERCTFNANVSGGQLVAVELDTIGCSIRDCHFEDTHQCIAISKSSITPSRYDIQGVDSFFATGVSGLIRIDCTPLPGGVHRQCSVSVQNVHRLSNGALNLLVDVQTGVTIASPKSGINQYRRAVNELGVISFDYQF